MKHSGIWWCEQWLSLSDCIYFCDACHLWWYFDRPDSNLTAILLVQCAYAVVTLDNQLAYILLCKNECRIYLLYVNFFGHHGWCLWCRIFRSKGGH